MYIPTRREEIENRVELYCDQLDHIRFAVREERQRQMIEDVLTNMEEEHLDEFLDTGTFCGLEELAEGMHDHAFGFANYRKERVSN